MREVSLLRQRVKSLLAERSLSMREASLIAGGPENLFRDALKNSPKGKAIDLRLQTTMKIAKALGCSIAYLAGETDHPNAYTEIQESLLERLLEEILQVNQEKKAELTPRQMAKWVTLEYKNEILMASGFRTRADVIVENIARIENK